MVEEKIGVVEHFFTKIGVAAIRRDTIHIVGATTDFKQKVESMQINKQPVDVAKPGDEIGIKVIDRVREHDVVYKVKEE